MMGWWWYGYMPYTGTGVVWFLLMILFWILIIWLVVSLVRGEPHAMFSGDSKRNSAVRILEERYARGEIDKKEFEEKLQDLTRTPR